MAIHQVAASKKRITAQLFRAFWVSASALFLLKEIRAGRSLAEGKTDANRCYRKVAGGKKKKGRKLCGKTYPTQTGSIR